MDNQQPLQQIPPAQNKWWPINWRHNIIFKMLGVIFILIFFAFLLLPVYLSPYTQGPRMFCAVPEGCPIDASDIIYGIIDLINTSTIQIILIITLTLYILFMTLKFKTLDTFDKIIFVCNFLILITSSFLYAT